MALFKVSRGNSESLSSVAKVDGHAYFTMDDGKFFIDYLDPDDNVVKRKPINAQDAETLGLHLPEDFALKEDIAAIINVDVLPTENIDEKIFYRLIGEEAFIIFQGAKNDFFGISIKMYAVDTLPEVGEYAEGDGSTYMLLYYQRSDNLSYGYLSASTTGSTDMWVEISQIIDLRLGGGYWGGYVEYQDYKSGASLENSKAYVIYNENPNIQLYQYKNGWIEIPDLTKIEREYAKKDDVPDLGDFVFNKDSQSISHSNSAADITFTSENSLELNAECSIVIQSEDQVILNALSFENGKTVPATITAMAGTPEDESDITLEATRVNLSCAEVHSYGTFYQNGVALDDKYALKEDVGGDAIIDVDELPTEDINDKSIYRIVQGEAFTVFQGAKNDFFDIPVKVYVVNTLPEVGEYATDDNGTYMLLYYQKSDNLSYGYLPASMTGATDMWLETSQIVAARIGAGYWGGYVEYQDYESGATLDNSKIYIVYNENIGIKHYSYKNGWVEIGKTEEETTEVTILTETSTKQELVDAYSDFRKGKPVFYEKQGSRLPVIQMYHYDGAYHGYAFYTDTFAGSPDIVRETYKIRIRGIGALTNTVSVTETLIQGTELVNITDLLTSQDTTKFLELTEKALAGEVSIIATMTANGVTSSGIVTGVSYKSYDDADWTIVNPYSTFNLTDTQVPIETTTMKVFVLSLNGSELTLATGDFPLPKAALPAPSAENVGKVIKITNNGYEAGSTNAELSFNVYDQTSSSPGEKTITYDGSSETGEIGSVDMPIRYAQTAFLLSDIYDVSQEPVDYVSAYPIALLGEYDEELGEGYIAHTGENITINASKCTINLGTMKLESLDNYDHIDSSEMLSVTSSMGIAMNIGDYSSVFELAEGEIGIAADYIALNGNVYENGVKLEEKYAPRLFIAGTQTSTTSVWKGTASNLTELKDGLTIHYWLPYSSTSTAVTLTLTLSKGVVTPKVPCYYKGSQRLTTQFQAGTMITLTYLTNVSVSGSTTKYTGWWASGADDSQSYSVYQYSTTTNGIYPLAFKYTAGNTSTTTTNGFIRYNNSIWVNPSQGLLHATQLAENDELLEEKYALKSEVPSLYRHNIRLAYGLYESTSQYSSSYARATILSTRAEAYDKASLAQFLQENDASYDTSTLTNPQNRVLGEKLYPATGVIDLINSSNSRYIVTGIAYNSTNDQIIMIGYSTADSTTTIHKSTTSENELVEDVVVKV